LKLLSKKYKTNYFEFCDSSLNNNPNFLEKVCDALIKYSLNIKWISMIRPDNLSENLLEKMKRSGCVHLRFGIESFSKRILKKMNKPFKLETALKSLQYSSKAGIINEVFLVVGFPTETEEDLNETISYIKEYSRYIDHVGFSIFRIDYGSLIFKNPKHYGITNIRLLENNLFDESHYAYDEIKGPKWKKIQNQQIFKYKILFHAVFNHIIKKKKNVLNKKHKIINLIPPDLSYFLYKNMYSNQCLRRTYALYSTIFNEEFYPAQYLRFN
jgi:radical SAM superfamily enzyme YgiQ (UPF0313 family)